MTHVQSLLYELYGISMGINSSRVEYIDDNRTYIIKFDSARTDGFPMLSITIDSLDDDYILGKGELKQAMRSLSWNTPHRIQAEEKATELLYSYPTSSKIHEYCQQLILDDTFHEQKNIEISLINDEANNSVSLEYTFKHDAIVRKHKISLYEDSGYCIFLTKTVSTDKLSEIKQHREKKIIHSTWQRNSHTDIVEFLLDPDGEISGRIIHPISSLDYEEFSYCAFILASQADRLEYIFSEQDQF